jgi:hypothetical protein
MGNLAAHQLVRQRREVFLGAQRIQRVHKVLGGVEQGSVEIEQHRLDGAVAWFLVRGHSGTFARSRVRCMR